MSHLQVISINDSEEWDAIVRSFKDYDVYYLSGYAKAFQIHGDGEPILFYYDDGDTRAMNVVMKRDIANDVHFAGKLPEGAFFDIVTPYGYGGFLFNGEASEEKLKVFDSEYSGFCKSEGIISEFVRFHPFLQNTNILSGIYQITKLGKTISINLNSKEQIWSELTSKNRNMIRKAQKSGVEIFWGRSIELYRDFIKLYNVTMDKDNAKEYYYFGESFYKSILNDLKHNALIFYAVYQDKIIAMSIILFANQKMHYHLSSTNEEYQHLAPTNLLLLEAARWGCENGYNVFHLGGGFGSKEDSIYKFKSSFNRNSDNTFSVGKKIFDEEKYEELISIRQKVNGIDSEVKIDDFEGFFPKYRSELINFEGNEK